MVGRDKENCQTKTWKTSSKNEGEIKTFFKEKISVNLADFSHKPYWKKFFELKENYTES